MMKILSLIFLFVVASCQVKNAADSGQIISGHAPVQNAFTLSTTLNKTWLVTETFSVALTFPKIVNVTGGTPSITVTMGTLTKNIPMSSGNNTATLLFTYTIAPGDDDLDGIQVSTTLNKNGASIKYDTTLETSSIITVPSLTTVTVNTIAGTPPVAINITPAAFNEDTQSIMTLNYSDVDSDLATACSLSSLVKVIVTQPCACAAGVCTVGVTGTSNSNGAASFAFSVTANSQVSNSATSSFTINPVADSPVASNITPAAFNEDTQQILTLSYTDGDADLATNCAISTPTNVTVTQACACAAGVCTVGVTGLSNYNGSASFNYTVTANSVVSNSALATLTITAVGDAPVAANITPAAFNEDIQSIITLSYSDTESDLATACTLSSLTNITISQACACAAGVCTVGVKGTSHYNGAASFAYTVTAATQTSNSASATLTINPIDDAPVAANITPSSFASNAQSIITLSYSDIESHQASICSITSPTNVTVTQACACAAGICTVGVTSTLNYVGSASFNYSVTANGLASNSALASLTVTPSASRPVADNISPAAFNEDIQSIITLSYTDPNSDLATTCSLSGLTNITITQACACAAGVCTVGVTGTLNHNGAASFNYTVTANSETSDPAAATLSITAVDDAPVAANITPASFNENIQSIITLSYTDAESDPGATCSTSALTNVTVTQACACAAGVCTVGVTGNPDYYGAASFTYTVTANSAVSNSATATLTINSVDSAPVANNISPAAFNEDTASIITLSYSDVESDQATSCIVSGLSNVTISSACACAAGVCTVGVTGTSNFNGAAGFNYTVSNALTSNSATATLSITSVDDLPVAANITPASFNENIQSIITLSYTDADSDLGATCSTSALTNVTVTQACACAAGVCTVGVTGNPDYYGAASFTYTVTANSAVSNSATATLTINSVDSAPVANNISPAAFNEDTASIITLSYSDVESDQATSCIVSGLSNVTISSACACAAGVCTVGVTGTSNFNGAAGFNYTVSNALTSNSATATLSITAVDDAPVAINLTPAAFDEDTASVITLTYTDAEGDFAASCSVSGLTNVTVSTACACSLGTCTVGVTGLSNYSGIASFTYTVTANTLTSNSATASLTISSVEDAAVAANITPASFNEDTQSVITLSYTDADSQSTTCAITPTNVTVTQACACAAGVCTVGVTGTLNYNGAASFTYTVTSNSVSSNTATANFTITAVNDSPTFSAIATQTGSINTAKAVAFTLTDVDNALTCASSVTMTSSDTAVVANGSVAWSGTVPNCTATFTPVTNASGPTTITLNVNDGSGGSATTNFVLNVDGVLLIWTNTGGTTITSHNFGTPGANTTATVNIKNIGNLTSAAVAVTDNAGSPKMSQTNSCTTIAAGASCPVTLNWDNSGGGGVRTEIYTAAANGSAPTLTVTGTK